MTREPGRAPPRHAHGDLTSLAPHERLPGKAGNPFQTKQGNRLSYRDQEGRRGSDEVVPGPSVFPSGEPGVSGDFWGSQEGCHMQVRKQQLELDVEQQTGFK